MTTEELGIAIEKIAAGIELGATYYEQSRGAVFAIKVNSAEWNSAGWQQNLTACAEGMCWSGLFGNLKTMDEREADRIYSEVGSTAWREICEKVGIDRSLALQWPIVETNEAGEEKVITYNNMALRFVIEFLNDRYNATPEKIAAYLRTLKPTWTDDAPFEQLALEGEHYSTWMPQNR
jgi:hypothetical protein